ncbi:hypothetical protein DITRI_Ditri01bG0163200 [Diplodiscus trichospermus]
MDILSFHACFIIIFFSKASIAADMISPSESLIDGMTLVSSDGSFQLGFFSPGSSKNRYLGIWYNNIPMQTVVWVANRINPINGTNGLLKIESTGKVVLLDQNKTAVWSVNSTEGVQNPILLLLETGNLVVRDAKDSNSGNYLWQSFDYPTDTMLPGMKIGIDLRTGFQRRLAAWKNWDDPSPGDLSYGVEIQGNPEMVVRKGSEKYYRSGLWTGDRFSGTIDLRSNPIYDYNFVWNEEEVYYIYLLKNKSVMSKIVLNQTENVRQRYTWNPETQTWKLFSTMPSDRCDRYELCGPNGNCDNNKFPACQCLKGFTLKSPETWNSSDWSEGCLHTKPLNCQGGDGFIRIQRVKTPDTINSWVSKTMKLKECRARCLQNCTCMAFTNLDIRRGGSGCAMWFGDLIDIKQFQSDGQDLYIRVSVSEAGTILLLLLFLHHFSVSSPFLQDAGESLEVILAMVLTNGTLANGQEIAVKRLSKSSGQGLNEFKNEVKLIAKLQHRNLVRLLGCCIQGEERILVYEYMPNKSLDSFIFGLNHSIHLNLTLSTLGYANKIHD